MSLRSLNTGHERKQSKAVCFTAGVAFILVVAALAYSFFSPKATPQETSTTSAMPTTTTTLEATTTTEEKPTTTTSASTSRPASTTTTLNITCYRNSDCGVEVEKRACYLENVYLKRISPICKKPGLPDSYCVSQEGWATGSIVSEPIPLEKCRSKCVNSTCQ